ncbi:MAG: thiol-disulfide oxidoreductase DCC family protein [Planctomycetota bacterium]
MDQDPLIVLFDGVCGLCNRTVQFIIRRDRLAVFRFAPLQSARGRALLEPFGMDADDLSTIVLIDGDRRLVRSDAALAIARRLRRPWSWLGAVLRIVPRPLRDLAYRFVARHRYRWFGRTDRCVAMTPEHRDRFLADDP